MSIIQTIATEIRNGSGGVVASATHTQSGDVEQEFSVVAPGSVEISQLLCRKLPGVCRVSDRAGPPQDSHLSPWFMLPSASLNGVGVPDFGLRGSMADPPVSPVNASAAPSRAPPHDSGPE